MYQLLYVTSHADCPTPAMSRVNHYLLIPFKFGSSTTPSLLLIPEFLKGTLALLLRCALFVVSGSQALRLSVGGSDKVNIDNLMVTLMTTLKQN
jgi:hypothetical protein